jgi:hypothetical protein
MIWPNNEKDEKREKQMLIFYFSNSFAQFFQLKKTFFIFGCGLNLEKELRIGGNGWVKRK